MLVWLLAAAEPAQRWSLEFGLAAGLITAVSAVQAFTFKIYLVGG